jgi:hypothetical protein
MLSSIELDRELVRRYERWLTVQRYSSETRRVYVRTVNDFSQYMNRRSVTSAKHFQRQRGWPENWRDQPSLSRSCFVSNFFMCNGQILVPT